MVGLSDVDEKLFRRIILYKNSVDLSNSDNRVVKKKIEPTEYGGKTIKSYIQKQKILSQSEVLEIIKGYKNGKSIYVLGEEFGCHRNTISQHLKKRGINVTNKLDVDIDELIKLYESGQTVEQIAEAVGISRSTVLDRLQKAGVRIRGRWG